MDRPWLLLALVAATLWHAAPGGAQTGAAGAELQVNSYTTGSQSSPAVATAPGGSFIVVWMSDGSSGTDSSGYSIQAQRFDPTGVAIGDQFQVNSYTSGRQGSPSVAVTSGGGFVVVWSSYGSSGTDSSSYSIQGQRFDPAGGTVGDEFQVNSYTPSIQALPVVSAGAVAGFVVVWSSYGSSGTDMSSYSVWARRYDGAGDTVGDEFQVNSYGTGAQLSRAVASDSKGGFVVVWTSEGSYETDNSPFSIQARRYDGAGEPIGDEFQVNTYTSSTQFRHAVATDPLGNFVVAWDSYGSPGSDSSGYSIHAQRYDASGGALASEVEVNSYTTDHQVGPAVAFDPDGRIFVVWTSRGSSGSDSSGDSIQAQHHDAAGVAVGSQFQVNSYTTLAQGRAAVASDAEGQFVVVWDSQGSSGSDSSERSIQARRYRIRIFAARFESGDTSEWSAAVP